MNENRGGAIFLTILGLGFGLYAVFSVLLTDGNAISELCRLLMGAGFLFCLISPKSGFMLWLVTCGYIDLVKRLMVLSGRISYTDLYYVLGIPPLMMAGICLSILAGAILGRRQISGWHLIRLGAACAVMGVSVLASLRGGAGLGGILPELANNGIYAVLLFLVPILFPSQNEMLRLLRLMVVVFAPVAVYGVIQQAVGFQDFEVEYLMTNLSIEIKQLFTNEVRAFSTLNSPTALAFVCAALLVFSLLIGWNRGSVKSPFSFPRPVSVLLALLFFAGLISSTTRSALVVIPVALLAVFMFRNGTLTRTFYVFMVLSFVGLVAASKWLLTALPAAMATVNDWTGGSLFAEQLLRLGTYTERLLGFSNVLANPAAYSLFGHGEGRGRHALDEFYNHDPLSTILVWYGTPALIAVIAAISILLWHMHHSVLRLEKGPQRAMAAVLLSVPLSYLIASMLQGNVLGTFPLNGFAWLCFGMIESLGQPQSASPSEGIPMRPPLVPQRVGRFRRNSPLSPPVVPSHTHYR